MNDVSVPVMGAVEVAEIVDELDVSTGPTDTDDVPVDSGTEPVGAVLEELPPSNGAELVGTMIEPVPVPIGPVEFEVSLYGYGAPLVLLQKLVSHP